jgi:hypothetical protein
MTQGKINDENQKRLAKGLHEKYPGLVYGMAKASSKKNASAGAEITSLKVKKITNEGCEISLVTCRGDLCEMNNFTYSFNPPLNSLEELLDAHRIKQLHNQVLSPKLRWLFTDPLAFLILTVFVLLGYATLIIGMEGILEFLTKAPRLENEVTSIFQSPRIFGYCVFVGFWITIVAHAVEAGMTVRFCAQTFPRLGVAPTAMWAFLVFCVGFPILSRLQELVLVQNIYSSKSK